MAQPPRSKKEDDELEKFLNSSDKAPSFVLPRHPIEATKAISSASSKPAHSSPLLDPAQYETSTFKLSNTDRGFQSGRETGLTKEVIAKKPGKLDDSIASLLNKDFNSSNSGNDSKKKESSRPEAESKMIEVEDVEWIPIDKATGFLVHTLLPSDNVERLCLNYGINALELKKANKAFSNDFLKVRKTVLIPTDKETLSAYLLKRREEKIERGKGKEDSIKEFMQKMSCPDTVATFYLKLTEYNLQKALELCDHDLKRFKRRRDKAEKVQNSAILTEIEPEESSWFEAPGFMLDFWRRRETSKAPLVRRRSFDSGDEASEDTPIRISSYLSYGLSGKTVAMKARQEEVTNEFFGL